MRLTRKKAVDLSIELWQWLAETGKQKRQWPGWESNGGKYEYAEAECFLCEYTARTVRKSCELCPYYEAYGCCDDNENTPFSKWDDAETSEGHKVHAQEFLDQLLALRK